MSKVILVLLSVTLIFGAGCAKKQLIKPDAIVTPITDNKGDSSEGSVRFKDWTSVEELSNIGFEYDSCELNDDATTILKKNANYLKENSSYLIIVEGHCDQRGTVEYNLALGQKRASVVRNYYISLGIPAKNIGSISYGKEKLLSDLDAESAYELNRRAETKVRKR